MGTTFQISFFYGRISLKKLVIEKLLTKIRKNITLPTLFAVKTTFFTNHTEQPCRSKTAKQPKLLSGVLTETLFDKVSKIPVCAHTLVRLRK